MARKIKIQLDGEKLKRKLNLRDGLDGKPGKDGKDGKSIIGPKGDRGEKGERGDSTVGPQGLPGKDGAPDTRLQIVEKINTGKDKDLKIEAKQVTGFDKFILKTDYDRAFGILDQRTQFLINKPTPNLSTYATIAYVDSQIGAENLFDRTLTTLSPHTAGDSLDMGAGAITGASLKATGLTPTRVIYATTAGLLVDTPLIYASAKFQTTDNSFETVTSSIVAGYRAVWGATYMGRLSGQSNGLCLDSNVTGGKILAIQSETFGGTTLFGKSYKLSIRADYNGLALLPAGVFFSGSNLASGQGMSFIPSDAGTAGVKFVLAYSNQTAWQNAVEFANVASGAGTLILAGGNTDIQIGTGVAGKDYKIIVDGETNDGEVDWMEDEDYFKFLDDLLIPAGEKIFFRDTAISINSANDGYLDLDADTEIRLNQATSMLSIANVGGTAPVADGTYSFYNDGISSGQVTSITTKSGIITAISVIP